MEIKLSDALKKYMAESKIEKDIAACRAFFMAHLIPVKNRRVALQDLSEVNQQFAAKNAAGYLFMDKEYHRLVSLGENTLKKHFTPALVKLYNKNFQESSLKEKDFGKDAHIFLVLLSYFTGSMEQLREAHHQSFNYQKNLLSYVYLCLSNNGLHPDILKREPEKFKRFNLVVHHVYGSRKPVTEFRILMTYEDYWNYFLKQYLEKKPVKFGGKLIPFDKIREVKITTTLLQEDDIPVFALKHNFSWNNSLKDIEAFISLCQDETETYHPNPFDVGSYSREINYMLIAQTRQFLTAFPDAKKLYDKAIKNYDNKIFQRNILDDLRLSLELVLRHILGNNKSLENQQPFIGKLYKQKGVSQEILNMFHKILEYYAGYQNTYIKHNDDVKSEEVEFVINITTTFMLFFIKNTSR